MKAVAGVTAVMAANGGDVALPPFVTLAAATGTRGVGADPGLAVAFGDFAMMGTLVTPRAGVAFATLESPDAAETPNVVGVALSALVTPGGLVAAFAGRPFSLSSSGRTTIREVTGVTKLYLSDRLVAFSVSRRRAAVSLARNRACSRS